MKIKKRKKNIKFIWEFLFQPKRIHNNQNKNAMKIIIDMINLFFLLFIKRPEICTIVNILAYQGKRSSRGTQRVKGRKTQ